jgi:hypothetical protein
MWRYLSKMTTVKYGLSRQGNSPNHFHKHFNQYTLLLVGHPLDLYLVLFNAVPSLHFPYVYINTSDKHFSGCREDLA